MTTRPWLTVSQAAAALKLSERTIRRRCSKGTLRGRLDTTESGPAWLIDPAEVPDTADTLRTPAAIAADTDLSAEAGEAAPTVPDPADRLRSAADRLRPAAAIAADTREADLIAALIAEKDARIRDLQKQLDATNEALEREQIAHGETRRLVAFGLSSPTLPTAGEGQQRPQQPRRPQPQRRPRSLWQILIGYRPKD